MPVNGVRVLPDIPKNMLNMEILIREFETGSMSANGCRDTASKASSLKDGNFVKKIVEAYESSVWMANENSQRERVKERSNSFNTFDVIHNRKSDSSLTIYDAPSSQCRKNLNEKFEIFSTPFESHEVEDDFVIFNRYRSESSEKTGTWMRSSSKINMYSSMGELLTNAHSNPLKRSETWNLKKRDQKLNAKTKNKVICSSPLEDVEDKDLNCEDPLDDILTSSCDSSSNNSYKNFQTNLYNFEKEQWQPEFASTSLSSLKSCSELSRNNINSADDSLLDSSFQDVTVTSPKDTLKIRENLQDSEPVSSLSSDFDQKLSRTVAASLNDDQLINIDNDIRMTWMSTLGKKLSRKRPLKKLLESFNTKLSIYKKVWRKSSKSAKKQPKEYNSDSGFTERFLSSSSSSSRKSWCSDPDVEGEPPAPPTFTTFGRTRNTCVSDKTWPKSSRMILIEVPRKEFTSDSKPFDSSLWVQPRSTISRKENCETVEPSLKSTMLPSSSKFEVSCGYPPLSKHPYLTRNGIPKHPFVAKTKLDQETEEKSIEEEEMKCDAKERESDTRELESSNTSSIIQTELHLSCSKMSEKSLGLSPNINCDLLRSRPCKSTSELDRLVPKQTPIHNIHMCSTEFLSTMHNNRYMKKESASFDRYATVTPKNLRFFMSREKSQAIERSLNA
ncbi:uncharacterized protein LOC105828364 [Monomorium pharaonis]|uniref:uncharacterized protein LOC105828364 n=1 Tax=Monomorium pharaonis TaxID=307658 RepID=UPI00063F9814|nr:uncharacterized protein LOC105828364 [Monomorium pharaonis]